MKIEIIADQNNEKEFINMMAWIELCGNIGHTCQYFEVGVDGDGSGKLQFKFDNSNQQKEFDDLKKEMLKLYDKNGKDLEIISFE